MMGDHETGLQRLADGSDRFRPQSASLGTVRQDIARARYRLAIATLVAPLLAPLAYAAAKLALSDAVNLPGGHLNQPFWRGFIGDWASAILPGFYFAALVFCGLTAGVTILLRRVDAKVLVIVSLLFGGLLGLVVSSSMLARPESRLGVTALMSLLAMAAGGAQGLTLAILARWPWRNERAIARG